MNVSRQSLILGLSHALDIAAGNNLSHSKSTAYLSVLIGQKIGLDEGSILEIFYAALLHDIGWSNFGKTMAHCIEGEIMLRKLPLSREIVKSVLYHHEFFDGTGAFKLSGDDIPISSQITGFASCFDNDFSHAAKDYDRDLFVTIREWLLRNSSLFSKVVINAFSDLIEHEFFLLDFFNQEAKYSFPDKTPVADNTYYGYDDVVKYAQCFADIIDRKSTFTYTHSHGIASLARNATAGLGYNHETQDKMYVAGLLHDIGKLHIPTTILHKNGDLTPEERFEINKHSYYTRRILEQIQGLEDIVDIAANHHERVDGDGYPYRLSGSQLGGLDKIMAICDVYQALSEARPYRERLSPRSVWGIIDFMAENGHLDHNLVMQIKQLFDLSQLETPLPARMRWLARERAG